MPLVPYGSFLRGRGGWEVLTAGPSATCTVYSLHRDPFAIHRQHMNRMLSGGFGYSPFLSITDGNMPGTRPASRRMQVMVLQQT